METLLGEAGYEVLTAPSAIEALKYRRGGRFGPRPHRHEDAQNERHRTLGQIAARPAGSAGDHHDRVRHRGKSGLGHEKGAFDYILKPFKNDEILVTIAKALKHRRLILANRLLNQELEKKYGFPNIVGESRVMEDILALVKRVAGSRATVLITGESGTGKELIARAIHQCSNRAAKSCISVNCAALTETLLESGTLRP